LTNDEWRGLLSRCLDEANRESDVQLVGFVFMPEHVHLLVHPSDPGQSIGRYLARFKQPFSGHIKATLIRHGSELLHRLTVRERPGKTCFRFWQEGSGYDRNLVSSEAIRASLDYIHENPVKRGLCRRAVDWRWSSARYYLEEPCGRQFESLPIVSGMPVDALS
jgi:putative transposase